MFLWGALFACASLNAGDTEVLNRGEVMSDNEATVPVVVRISHQGDPHGGYQRSEIQCRKQVENGPWECMRYSASHSVSADDPELQRAWTEVKLDGLEEVLSAVMVEKYNHEPNSEKGPPLNGERMDVVRGSKWYRFPEPRRSVAEVVKIRRLVFEAVSALRIRSIWHLPIQYSPVWGYREARKAPGRRRRLVDWGLSWFFAAGSQACLPLCSSFDR